MDYFRLKTTWTAEKADGGLEKTTTEELVYASTFTEAEAALHALAENRGRNKYSEVGYDIVKTKIGEVLWNSSLSSDGELIGGYTHNFFTDSDDTGLGLYSVKVMYVERDERTGKDKRTQEIIYVPAVSNTDAAQRVEAYLRKYGETRYHIVRDVRFDRAEAILWSPEVYEQKING